MFRDVAWIRFIGPYHYGTFTNRTMYGWCNYHTYKHPTSAYAQIFYWGGGNENETKLDFKQALQQHCMLIVKRTHERSELLNEL